MKRVLGFSSFFFLVLPLGVQAQTPEMEKVQVFVGEWAYEHTGGHGTMSFEMFGDNLLLAKEEYTTNAGAETKMFHVIGYDRDEGVYWWRSFTRSPGTSYFKGTTDGKTFTWNSEVSEGRQRRFVQEIESDGLFNFRWESSVEGGPWEVTIRGTNRRVQ